MENTNNLVLTLKTFSLLSFADTPSLLEVISRHKITHNINVEEMFI